MPQRLPLARWTNSASSSPRRSTGIRSSTRGAQPRRDRRPGRPVGRRRCLLLEGAPYQPPIGPGRYPLQVVLRACQAARRVAFVQLKLADHNAESWSNATTEGEAELQDEEISVFEVESSGRLFDAAALALSPRTRGRLNCSAISSRYCAESAGEVDLGSHAGSRAPASLYRGPWRRRIRRVLGPGRKRRDGVTGDRPRTARLGGPPAEPAVTT